MSFAWWCAARAIVRRTTKPTKKPVRSDIVGTLFEKLILSVSYLYPINDTSIILIPDGSLKKSKVHTQTVHWMQNIKKKGTLITVAVNADAQW